VSGRVWRQAQQLCAPRWLGASAWGLVVEEGGAGVELWLEYDARRVRVSIHTTGISHPPAPSEQQVHSKVSLRRAVDAVQRCGVACVRADHQRWESGTTRKQPANLEAAEESLSILSDYTPTVRPPPKRS
jgi:hypothetical protein